jgi:hypothetical protein
MRTLYIVIVLVFLGSTGFVESQTQSSTTTVNPASSIVASYPNLEAQAKEYGNAFVRDNMERLVELTYPRYVESTGGKENLMTTARGTRTQFERDGMQLLSWVPTGVSQLLEQSGSIYAVVPMAMRMKGRGYVLEDYDCLIAMSADRGEHWTFVSSSCVRLRDAFPQVAEKLVLCPEKQPVRLAQP